MNVFLESNFFNLDQRVYIHWTISGGTRTENNSKKFETFFRNQNIPLLRSLNRPSSGGGGAATAEKLRWTTRAVFVRARTRCYTHCSFWCLGETRSTWSAILIELWYSADEYDNQITGDEFRCIML